MFYQLIWQNNSILGSVESMAMFDSWFVQRFWAWICLVTLKRIVTWQSKTPKLVKMFVCIHEKSIETICVTDIQSFWRNITCGCTCPAFINTCDWISQLHWPSSAVQKIKKLSEWPGTVPVVVKLYQNDNKNREIDKKHVQSVTPHLGQFTL